MAGKKLDLDKIMQDAKAKRIQELSDLQAHSKELYELVATEYFTVDDVVGESYSTSFTPDTEIVLGGSSRVYSAGFISKLVLRVSPDNHDVPVKTIHFDGFSGVRVGDYICAKIPRYDEKRVGIDPRFIDKERVFYFDRVFHSEESAIELTLLSAGGNVLRRDRSVNYDYFVKK